MKQAVIIIVNWNGAAYLPECLASIKKQTNQNYQIVLVDNASTDKSVEYVLNAYSEVHVIRNHANLGFAEGNNIGMCYALENNFDYIVLLNQDTVVDEKWLAELISVAENNEKVGAAQSLIMLYNDQNRINSAGNITHYLGFGYCGCYQKTLMSCPTPVNDKMEICYASGASVLFTAKALKDVGLFDEDLYLYHEDTDLSLRLRERGYKIILAKFSIVYHKYEFSRSIAKYYYMERNRLILVFLHYKLPTIILILPALLVMEAGILAFSFKGGFWKEKLKSYKYFFDLKNLKNIHQKRKTVQANRVAGDKELMKNFSGTIEFQDIDNFALDKIANPVFNFYWAIIRKIIFW